MLDYRISDFQLSIIDATPLHACALSLNERLFLFVLHNVDKNTTEAYIAIVY